MIMAGYDIIPGDWTLVDPLAGSVITYDFSVNDTSKDRYSPGTGTWSGLSRIQGFFQSSNLDPRIYSA